MTDPVVPPARPVPAPGVFDTGVWSVPVPIPGSPLGFVVVYALATDGGLVLIDAGWNADESWDALGAGLSAVGLALGDVRGVLVTHLHPDHYGLAPRIREATGAWVAAHPDDLHMITQSRPAADRAMAAHDEWLRRAGGPAVVREDRLAQREAMYRFLLAEPPDLLLGHGEAAPEQAAALRVLHTPGHTDGHVCLHDPARRMLFSGDHVLPRISPNVSSMITLHADPLGDFLRSLAAVRDLDVDRVAAAHVGEVPDLAVRVDELLRHHDERLAEACAVLAAGAQTAWEVATGMTWKRGWDGLDVGLRRMAVGETHAHLLRLAVQGTVLRTPAGPDGVERWVLAEGSGTV